MTIPPHDEPKDSAPATAAPARREHSLHPFGMPVQTTGVSGSPANPSDAPPDQRLRYMPALDGIRAISIAGVMFYHSGLNVGAGGFIGVSVFFVLSGYLITSLLVKEWMRAGTVSLRRFWARRARRLLPALLVLLIGIAFYAWLIAPPDTLGSLRIDAIATLFYFGNWHQIFSGQGYFAKVAVESPLLHTWSLAIEEQFYLLWPLVVLGMLKWWRRLEPLLILAAVGAVASATEMFLLYQPGVDPSRLYYGTDTRAQDLLVGAVVAIVMIHWPPATNSSRRQRKYSLLAIVAAVAFGVEWSRLNGNSAFPYRGGFFMADLLVGLVLIGVTQAPKGPLARVLSCRPLTYVGQISYGLYLWHLPIFLVLNESRTGLTNWWLFLVRVLVSFAFAVASAKLVEIPIRRGAIHSWKARILTPLAAGLTAGVILIATTAPAAVAVPVNATTGLSTTQVRELAASKAFTSHPIRFMLFGDSVGLTLGIGLSNHSRRTWGVAFEDETTLGCNLDPGETMKVSGVVGTEPTTCAGWQTHFAADVARYRPQVVGLELGRWETLDTKYKGTWTHIGQPLWDNHLTAQLNQLVAIFSAHGAKVLLFTMPYLNPPEAPNGSIYPENLPSRVNAYNSLIRKVAAQHPGVVAINNLNKEIDPHGHFASKINNIPVRWSDGIHITIEGGMLLRPQILPQVVSLGLGHATS